MINGNVNKIIVIIITRTAMLVIKIIIMFILL